MHQIFICKSVPDFKMLCIPRFKCRFKSNIYQFSVVSKSPLQMKQALLNYFPRIFSRFQFLKNKSEIIHTKI